MWSELLPTSPGQRFTLPGVLGLPQLLLCNDLSMLTIITSAKTMNDTIRRRGVYTHPPGTEQVEARGPRAQGPPPLNVKQSAWATCYPASGKQEAKRIKNIK